MKNIKVTKVVNELVANGGSLASAMRKAGYSANTARTPSKMTNTKAFQEELRPVVEQLEIERQRLITAIADKDLSKVRYEDAVRSLDIVTKNIQLLGGKPTENNKLEISWE